ncbi:hypothetical protein D3C76_1049010 [compost metagenome]
MLSPVTSQVRPSVSLAGGTICSTRAMATISVGAKNSPATNTASDKPRMFAASNNGKVVTAVATPPYRNRRASGTFERSAPKASPARHEPMAYTDSTMLAAAG